VEKGLYLMQYIVQRYYFPKLPAQINAIIHEYVIGDLERHRNKFHKCRTEIELSVSKLAHNFVKKSLGQYPDYYVYYFHRYWDSFGLRWTWARGMWHYGALEAKPWALHKKHQLYVIQ
jgi:hypothetical protein